MGTNLKIDQNTEFFIHEYASENIVGLMAVILYRGMS